MIQVEGIWIQLEQFSIQQTKEYSNREKKERSSGNGKIDGMFRLLM